jgi:hypothetical protein
MAMRDILGSVEGLGDEQFQKNQLHAHGRDGGRGDDRPDARHCPIGLGVITECLHENTRRGRIFSDRCLAVE